MKKYIKYLFGVLILVVFIVLVKNEFSAKLLKNANYGMPALIELGDVDNLYLGSSMFRQGIDIMTLEENEHSNYILSYNGNQPVLEYYQLQNLLNNNVHIKNLYVDLYAYSAWAQPKISDEKMLMEFGIKNKIKLWNLTANGTYIENAKAFWQMFVTGNNEILTTWFFSSKIIDRMFYKGGNMNKPKSSGKDKLESLNVPKIEGNMNSIQKEYSHKIINLARENGINVIYIESPKYSRMAYDEGYISAMKQYIEFLKEEDVKYVLCDSTWKLTEQNEDVIRYYYDNSNSEYFVDNGHLSYEGRVEFTKQLKILSETLVQ